MAVTQNLREQDSNTDESDEDEVVTCDEDDNKDIFAEIGSENKEEEYEEHKEGNEILYMYLQSQPEVSGHPQKEALPRFPSFNVATMMSTFLSIFF